MKEQNLYKLIISILVLLNVGVVAFFLMNKPPHPPKRGDQDFKHKVEKLLQLSEKQAQDFHELAMNHHHTMGKLSEKQQEILIPYFESIIDTNNLNNEEDILEEVQSIERKKIKTTQQHLLEVKSLLLPDQLPLFETFVKEFSKNVVKNQKKSPRPPKDFRK